MTAIGAVQWLAIGLLHVAALNAMLVARGYRMVWTPLPIVFALLLVGAWPVAIMFGLWMRGGDAYPGPCDCDPHDT